MGVEALSGRAVVHGLSLPEGPLVTADGRVLFVQIGRGEISELHTDGSISTYAHLAGAPHALAEGADGQIYVTQAGDVEIGAATREPIDAGIQVVDRRGRVRWLTREVDGSPLQAPNDLCFAADGRLYFTDSGGPYDPSDESQRARLCAVDAAGRAETVAWLGCSYANGIGCAADGTLYWTESYMCALCAMPDGQRSVALSLREHSAPDGILTATDGRIAIATTTAGLLIAGRASESDGRLAVIGAFREPAFATNVASDGTVLYVTDFGDFAADRDRAGVIWQVQLPIDRTAWAGF